MSPERIIAHAVLGCVQQASSGGQCGPGAAAAAFGKIATGLSEGLNSIPAQFAVTTVVGGTVSVIGGGKFANGAAQAGFGYLFNQLTPKSDSSCSDDGRRCTMTTSEERLHFTGKVKVQWNPIDWDDPMLMKWFSIDVMTLIPNVARKLPGVELKVEGATQFGELLHEARVDRQFYRLSIIDQVETSRVPLNYVQGNSHRWVSAPSGPDLTKRTQIQSCIFVICSDWKR
jgi:hypothetical protein